MTINELREAIADMDGSLTVCYRIDYNEFIVVNEIQVVPAIERRRDVFGDKVPYYMSRESTPSTVEIAVIE